MKKWRIGELIHDYNAWQIFKWIWRTSMFIFTKGRFWDLDKLFDENPHAVTDCTLIECYHDEGQTRVEKSGWMELRWWNGIEDFKQRGGVTLALFTAKLLKFPSESYVAIATCSGKPQKDCTLPDTQKIWNIVRRISLCQIQL